VKVPVKLTDTVTVVVEGLPKTGAVFKKETEKVSVELQVRRVLHT
jgi:hypothetical protein